MHILYRDMHTTSGVTGFGLKFSSLTIMKQHLFGSGGKVRGSHVNKIVEVQGLELYCYTYQGSDKSRSVGNSVDSKTWESAISQASEKVNLLAPLDVSLCLSVNRSGGFDSSAPQYLVNIQLKSMLIYVDEVQIQQVMSFCDYLLTSQLREKYGRYRPWWSPLDKKLKGWQIAWWHYALNSVLFDIHKRLRKTSWKYLGARLNVRRKYVNLYKTKLKCLQQEQVIPEDVIHMLEEIEKESDIDEILSYRSAAERELQDILLAHTSNNVNTSKSLEGERTFNKPRGWLNWLSRGMLGAGGTDDSSQFSGIISDDVLKDIYEATEFHPVQTVDADAAATDKMCLSSIKFSINQLSVTLQRMKLGCAIAHLTLNEISVESEIWEEETSFNAKICSCEMLNPINNELVLFTRVDHDGGIISFPQPLINIHADMHSPHKVVNLSVIVQPLELTYNSDFVNNILALFHVVEEFETLNYRILLSMNGIDNIKSRLLSKVDYMLSHRKKMLWDVNFATIVINIPWGKANFEAHKLVLDVGELSIVSKNNKGFVMATSDLLDDFIEGYQLQDLYDHFEITISNFQMNLWASCSYVPLPIIERFDGSLALKLCIIPDESVLKRLEVGMEVSSIVAHISPSLHGLLTELITDFILPQFTQLSSDSYMLRKRPSGFAPLNIFWISANADVKSVALFIDLEIDAGNPCSLTLSFQEFDIRVDKSKTMECWISIKTLEVKCHSSQIDEKDNVLCSSKTFMEQSFRLHYKQTYDFLWGPLTPTVSPIFQFCMRKETAKSRESLLELSFGIQNVSCVLPPEFLAVIIGYFSLPDWSPTPRKPPIVENSNHIDLCEPPIAVASCPISITTMVNDCQLAGGGVSVLVAFEALVDIINQFSLTEKRSKAYNSNTSQFLKLERQLREDNASPPASSSENLMIVNACVKSMSLRLHHTKGDSVSSDIIAEANLQFTCSASFRNDELLCLKISFSALSLFSFLNSVMLFECTPNSSFAALKLTYSISKENEYSLLLYIPSVDVWLHTFDWSELLDLVHSCVGEHPASHTLSISPENLTFVHIDEVGTKEIDASRNCHRIPSTPTCLDSKNVNPSARLFRIEMDVAGATVHIPVWLRNDAFNVFEGNHYDPLNDLQIMIYGNQHGFLAVTLQRGTATLVQHGKSMRLEICLDQIKGSVELHGEDELHSLPVFQLFQVTLDADISSCLLDDIRGRLDIQCDNLDVWLSDQMLYFWCLGKFQSQAAGTSQFIISCMDSKVHLRKASLIVTNGKLSSAGPLLEFLICNLLLHSRINEKDIEVSVECDIQANYNNIDKVFWEPFIELWSFNLFLSRIHDKTSLITEAATEIRVESTSQLNLNITESFIEVISRTVEVIKDAWGTIEMSTSSESLSLNDYRLSANLHGRRHAPYVLQNLTSLPIFFDVHTGENVSNTLGLSLTKSGKVLQPGFSVPIDVEDTPDKLIHYNYVQCPDRLRERQSSSAAHHLISFQLEGTSMPSGPFSMDLVGMRCFEVDFSKTSSGTGSITNGDALKICTTVEGEVCTESKDGFIVPVVIDVSIRPYTKIVRLYSTVLLSNATSVPLEVRLDIPFSVSPKILDPIYPGQQCPLPLHLAEAGLMKWRPVGSAYLWSEAYNIQNILSHENRLSILRSFVCYPSHPSSDPFRCCISVCDWSLPSPGPLKMGVLHSKCDVLGTSETFNELSHNTLRSKKRYIHRMTLSSPLVLKNYLPESVSITIENGGVTSSALLSEVENSFFHIDSSHDLTITFHLCGFNPSSIKFPRAETFVETAKCSGTIFSTWDTVTFDPISSCGPLCVTVEKVMDAFSGARELCISVPFLLYNCTWLPLVVSNAINETKGHYCIVPSCYALDEKDLVPSKKDGLGLLSPDLDSDIAPLDNRLPISVNSHPITNSNENRSEKHARPFLSYTVVHQYSHTHSMYSQKPSTFKNWSGPSSQSSLRSSDLLENESDKVNCCMFSPDSSFSSDETVVKVCRFLSPCITNHAPYSHWSNAFSLVPPTGSTSVIVPQPSKTSGYIMSVSATDAPFSGRTKIISFQPRYVISNACNKDVCYRQKGTNDIFFLEAGKHSHIQWIDTTRELLLSVRFVEPGWQWSGCFLPEHLGDTQVKMRNFVSGAVNMIRVEVQSADFSIRDEKIVESPQGNSGTNLVLLSDDDTGFMPYRIDNFTKERIRIYQQKCDAFETMIHSYSSCPYAWDEPCYPHRLTIEVPGERIIGSYTLDDVKEYGHVCLSATYEKPERTLCISVCSEGATKVLRIIDSSCHDLNDSRGLHFTQLKDKGKHDRKPESATHFNDRIVVDIPFVGISLINSLPEELLFACARNITIVFKQSLDQQKVSLQIMSLQIDNQLPTTPYPVILSLDHRTGITSSRAMRETTPESQEPAFSLEVATWRNRYLSLLSFKYIGLRVAEVHLEIDQEVVLRLLDFIKSVSSRMKGRVLPHMSPSLPLILSDLESDLSMYSYSLDFETLKSRFKQQFTLHSSLYHEISKSSVLPSITPIGAPWQKIHLLARKQKKLYVELLDMSSIKLTLSFSSSPWMLRNGVLTSGESLIHRGLMALADVEGAQIHLKHLVLSHQLASWESIQKILSDHYSRQFLHEMYKVLGSAGVIGNPMGFARNVTLGIKDFLSAPLQSALQSRAGLITGMAQGTSSLFSNTVYAISDTATQFSKAAKKGIVAFTFDDHSIANMDRPQKRVSSNSKGVINELLEGLTGLLQSPIKGAEKHGLPGIVSGIALGMTGLVAKPTASVLDVTGKTAQSIKNWSKRLHSGNQQHYRVRLPRHLSREYPLRSYSWEEAIGASVLREADDCSSNLKDEALIICDSLKEEGKFAIITKKLLLVVSSKIFANLGKPELQGVPANLEWLIETEIGMDSIIHFDLDEQSVVHIVGSRPDILVRQNQQRRGPRRNNDPHDPLPLFQTDLAFASKEKAQNFLGTLSSSIHRTKEQRRGHGHVLHQSSVRHRF
ncbi:unnamed protein product [Cuscuta campestris]|uniref:Vacuolar protein sorting-associated protein 13 VPS13 adaptor binding domain-containing protein n=1 Tax=Cuscuta campestris TaxID=132261 RepID=A0A484M6P3_9ASTE|nr:unnamed protein product [Cuscuta campestris]